MDSFLPAWIQLDPIALVQAIGYLGIALFVFAESGILLGIFLPGDSLLFAAGLLSASEFFAFGPLVFIVVSAAILGDSAGYWFGAKIGNNLFKRKDSRFFKQEYIARTQKFFETYGGRAIVLARFVPIVRTIAPILAGVGSMNYRKFLSYNSLGGFVWGAGMVSLGYFLGSIIPDSERYVLPLSLGIVAISFIPFFINHIRSKRPVYWILFFVTPFLLLIFITTEVILANNVLLAVDGWFENLLLGIRTPFFLLFFHWITALGSTVVVIMVTGIAGIVLFFSARYKAYAAGIVTTVIGASGTSYGMKIFIERARPSGLIPSIIETSFSFPSGHATLALALYGFLTYFFCKRYPKNAKTIVAISAPIILAIGFSRLYLGVHFPSDVLAGYLLGGLWLLIGIEITALLKKRG